VTLRAPVINRRKSKQLGRQQRIGLIIINSRNMDICEKIFVYTHF